MELTTRQRRSLDAICDTFCPSEDGLAERDGDGRPRRRARLRRARPAQRAAARSGQLLSLWDSAPLTALGGGWLARFSRLAASSASRCCCHGATAACRSAARRSRRCAERR